MNDAKRVIVALDYPDKLSALNMADQLDPQKCRVKVGKELFTRAGPAVVEALHGKGFDVFLDLKFHDIPNTTAKAVRAAAELGVWMVNVHASGGRRMMEAARNELDQVNGANTLLIAVTVLTSMERQDLADIGLDIEPLEQVKRLALLTQKSGLDGVVCSAQEVKPLRQIVTPDFQLVTPGIRPADAATGDQKRIMTPGEAISAGSTHLVIGRPITQADEPVTALARIQQEILAAR
ncbi:orotidine-5'-phosphate decarboxylase [Amphritea sp. 2_MG-2023]|jgi:orotidine-5'-phosphate decarboxylase|uniref:orotidine-5'-phosphate decarboxylase n=1 Tax=Amphritea TaxID=515417 RepID=UPI001C066294|nr:MULTISPECIES: orotidine-5'-phosphate decarboxylase [Amphritea]MBU2965127.1 orotidine-5'-phosphate decarboxylase [Amphritea atlantica]MDO6418912.1 orotidine-5'-phosphate decarboxylase [Amphritea sp. 2_MG-2023]MDX2423723.1 orotidine-5'-phosphate decarboxylase [Amphritea sp.]